MALVKRQQATLKLMDGSTALVTANRRNLDVRSMIDSHIVGRSTATIPSKTPDGATVYVVAINIVSYTVAYVDVDVPEGEL